MNHDCWIMSYKKLTNLKRSAKLFFILLIFILAFCGSSNAFAAKSGTGSAFTNVIYGDVNNDGIISVKDATVIQCNVGDMCDFNSLQMLCADVNADNKVTISDATSLQKYLVYNNKSYQTGKLLTTDLTSFEYTDNGKEIAINNCTENGTIIIPAVINNKPVTTISDFAFECNNNITCVYIPETVTKIQSYPFSECTSLKDIIVAKNNPNYCSENGILYNKDKTSLIVYPAGKENRSFTVPDGVKTLEAGAMYGAVNLEEFNAGNTLQNINTDSISSCQKLKTIILNESIDVIDINAFSFNKELQFVNIPSGVTINGKLFDGGNKYITIHCADTVQSSNWSPYWLSDIEYTANVHYGNRQKSIQNNELLIKSNNSAIKTNQQIEDLSVFSYSAGQWIKTNSYEVSNTKFNDTGKQSYTVKNSSDIVSLFVLVKQDDSNVVVYHNIDDIISELKRNAYLINDKQKQVFYTDFKFNKTNVLDKLKSSADYSTLNYYIQCTFYQEAEKSYSGYYIYDIYINDYWGSDCKTILDKANNILQNEIKISSYSSEYEKVLAIYNWITKNVSYDVNAQSNIDKLKYCQTINSALVDKSSVCGGFANTFQYLCKLADINCLTVTGKTSKTANGFHAWNVVQVNNQWYYCDSTWDAGKTQQNFSWFLKGNDVFSSRVPDYTILNDLVVH